MVNGVSGLCTPETVKGLRDAGGINIVRFDVFTLLSDVAAHPEAFDLSNGTDACITPSVFFGAICRKPRDYVFWDGIHPTAAMRRIVAREARALLPVASVAGEQED